MFCRYFQPRNIFFSLEDVIKIGDFGLVKVNCPSGAPDTSGAFPSQSHTQYVGTEMYMAPETKKSGRYSHKIDIYSLGVIFFELLVPFDGLTELYDELNEFKLNNFANDLIDPQKVINDRRTLCFEHIYTSYNCFQFNLLQLMLSEDPDVRPEASEILQAIVKRRPRSTGGNVPPEMDQ